MFPTLDTSQSQIKYHNNKCDYCNTCDYCNKCDYLIKRLLLKKARYLRFKFIYPCLNLCIHV